MYRSLNGVLLLDKPVGLSSNKILQKVKRLFSAKKAGYTGCLDVLASGMLPICFGEATKFARFLSDSNKHYQVCAHLGKRTTTADSEGEIIYTGDISSVNIDKLNQIILNFCGEIDQVPPMFSSIKYKGTPLYRLARKGIEVERNARKVVIYELSLKNWSPPFLNLEVYCSKGTYVRSLVDDIGLTLGCGAYVKTLHRTGVSDFNQSDMHSFDDLQNLFKENGFTGIDSLLLPVDVMLKCIENLSLNELQVRALYAGQKIRVDYNVPKLLCLMFRRQFIGLGEVVEPCQLKVKRLLGCDLLEKMQK